MAAQCLSAFLGPEPDSDLRDDAYEAACERRMVGGEVLAEALLSIIALRRGLEK